MTKPESKIKKYWNHPWTIGIGCVFLTFILPFVSDYKKQKPFLTTIKSVSEFIYESLILFFNYKITLGSLLLTLLVIALLIYIVIKILINKWETNRIKEKKIEQDLLPSSKPAKPLVTVDTKPNFLNYKKDTIKGWKWSWDYKKKGNLNYMIDNLQGHCKDDDTTLIVDGINFFCPRCDKNWNRPFLNDGSIYSQHHKIKVLIADNIRKKYNEAVEIM